MDEILGFQIISRIFVYCQRPELALVSRLFHQVSTSTSVQADYMILEFGKVNVYSTFGYQYIYPILSKKEALVVALVKKGAYPFNHPESILADSFRNGWTKVFKELLLKYKLTSKTSHSDHNTRSDSIILKINESDSATISPFININNLDDSFIKFIGFKGYIDILNLLLNAHKLIINLRHSNSHLAKLLSAKGKNEVKIHKEFDLERYGYNIVLSAIECNHPEILELVLPKIKFSINELTDFSNSAAKSNNNKINEIIGRYTTPDLIYNQDALKNALLGDNLSLVRTITLQGIEIPDIQNQMSVAAKNDNIQITTFLHNYMLTNQPENRLNSTTKQIIDTCCLYAFAIAMVYHNKDICAYFINNGYKISELGERQKYAFQSRDPEFIKFVVENGANIDISNGFPLMYAARSNLDIFKYLVDNGADIYKNYDWILSIALNGKRTDIVQYLLNKSNKPESPNPNQFIEILKKSENDDFYELICVMIDYNPLLSLSAISCDIIHPVHKKKNPLTINLIIETYLGLNCIKQIQDLFTVFSLSIKLGLKESIEKALGFIHQTFDSSINEKITNLETNNNEIIDENKNDIDFSVLEYKNQIRKKSIFLDACELGLTDIVEQIIILSDKIQPFLTKTNNPKQQNSLEKQTMINEGLTKAVGAKKIQTADYLLNLGADMFYKNGLLVSMACKNGLLDFVSQTMNNRNEIQDYGKCLILASKNGHLNICKLIMKKYQTNISQIDIDEAFIYAYLNNYTRVSNYLLDKISDKKVQEKVEFLFACKNGNYSNVNKMLLSGVDIQFKDNLGLLWAITGNHIEVVQLLIRNGADVQARKNRPLITCCRKGYYDVAKLLISNGANVNARNNMALTCASIQDHIDIVRLLLKLNTFIKQKNNKNGTNTNCNSKKMNCNAVYWACKSGSFRSIRAILTKAAKCAKETSDTSYVYKALVWTVLGQNANGVRALAPYIGDYDHDYFLKAAEMAIKSNWETFYDSIY
ncbi:hypothetical protein BB558_004136 [Smittium angustum]|uniref:Uncharacterized protein n=1 Tax=Smittium angustum TaxID=133377 RepID=A0A2U1J466_SMIAN|nr:hypothetical protein BB558_004136 [Smittium angustum]